MKNPNQRRLGPVTWMALLGAIVFGLIGVVAAHIVGGLDDVSRAILVLSITSGAGLGIVAGSYLERDPELELFGRLRMGKIFGSPFFFAGCSLLMVTTYLFTGMFTTWFYLTNIRRPLSTFAVELRSFNIPFFVVWLIGLLFALHRWKHSPRAARLVVLSILGFGVIAIVDISMGFWRQWQLNFGGGGLNRFDQVGIDSVYAAWGIVRSATQAICLGVLLAAAFVDRKLKPEPSSRQEPPPIDEPLPEHVKEYLQWKEHADEADDEQQS